MKSDRPSPTFGRPPKVTVAAESWATPKKSCPHCTGIFDHVLKF